MLIQNTNPMTVAPEQALVRQGFARQDLFVAVHEQFMTETAQMADLVLPATMFMEHDDLYYGGGHQHISVGAKLIEPPGECRSNHEVLRGISRRVKAVHPGFEMSPRELIDATLKKSGHGDIEALEADIWRDLQPDFRTSHYLDGFAHADGKFHFKADWAHVPLGNAGMMGAWDQMPSLPDHWTSSRRRMRRIRSGFATSPSRSFLNTSFNETPSSQAREGAPSVMIHPDDAAPLAIADGDAVTLGNMRGETTLTAKLFDGVRRGVLIAESVHPEQGAYRRPRHQHADRRRSRGAGRRRRVPRQQGLGEKSIGHDSDALNHFAIVSSFETHRFAMLLRMRSKTLCQSNSLMEEPQSGVSRPRSQECKSIKPEALATSA